MPVKTRTARGCVIAAMLSVGALGLQGCAAGDVEYNGKIFELVGLAGEGAGRQEPKTQARAPLVLPPDVNRLPEPGSTAAPVVTGSVADWPRDRDAAKAQDANARKAAQKKYCEDGNWKEKALGKDIEAAQGPDGSCHGNIFTLMGNSLFGD